MSERYGVGVTKPILITMPEGEMHAGTWHLGPYAVYVPFSAIEEQNAGRFHFIPLKNPKANRADIVHEMEDHVCRCGAHVRILAAVEEAAATMKGSAR